jgi:alkylated DNA repair dioxygenase AlkB
MAYFSLIFFNMNTLFPIGPVFPDGFSYVPHFITKDEEEELLKAFLKTELKKFVFKRYEAKRKVQSFGKDWSFDRRFYQQARKFPKRSNLIAKVASHLSIKKEDFAELLLTEYPIESVINWHRDAPPFDLIAGISLLSNCTLLAALRYKSANPQINYFHPCRKALALHNARRFQN